jgi:hypothetical protein
MCFSVKPPKPPKPPPTPDKTAAQASAEDETRKRLQASKGTEQNIFTSPLGDPNYGKNSVTPTAIGTTFFANFGSPTPSTGAIAR